MLKKFGLSSAGGVQFKNGMARLLFVFVLSLLNVCCVFIRIQVDLLSQLY